MIVVPAVPNSASRPSDAARADLHRDRLAAGVGHLRGDGALPDQFVERVLVAVELALHLAERAEAVAGGTDRLVRLLRVLDLPVVVARRVGNRLGAVELARLVARRGDRRLRQRRRVGAHVGDVAVLVQALGDAHRVLRREAQLAARLLLERRGHERRRPGGACTACARRSAPRTRRPRARRRARGPSPRRARRRRRCVSSPVRAKSRPCATFFPSTALSFAP